MRTWILVSLFVLPVLVVLPAPLPVAAQSTDPATPNPEDKPWEVVLLKDSPLGYGSDYRVRYRDAQWRPGVPHDQSYALVAGGLRGPDHNPCAWSALLKYDGAAWEVLVNRTGCMLFRISWAPDGSHALIVGEKDTILRYDHATKEVRSLWGVIANPFAADDQFLARDVAYRPDGSYALITGNDLIRYYPAQGSVPERFEAGLHRAGEFFDAIEWSPDGRYAIMEMGATDRNGTRALGVMSFYADDDTLCKKRNPTWTAPCVYPGPMYGHYDPGFVDVSDITFGPLGKVAWAYGLDGGYGTIFRYLEADNSWAYPYDWQHLGRITSMAWQPNSFRVLWTGEGDNQLVVSEAWSFKPVLNNTICKQLFPVDLPATCPSLSRAAWHPSGAYALLVGSAGWAFKYLPKLLPTVDITYPSPNQVLEGETVKVTGIARPPFTVRNVTRVEWAVDDGPWAPAVLGEPKYLTPFNFTMRLADYAAGDSHRLRIRASDDGGASWGEATLRFYVRDTTRTYTGPTLAANATTVLSGFTLSWTPVPDAMYIVQRARDATFADAEEIPISDPTLVYEQHGKGRFFFRVKAVGGLNDSPWSNVVTVDVTVGIVDAPQPHEQCAAGDPTCQIPGNGTPNDTNQPPDRNVSTNPPVDVLKKDPPKTFLPAPAALAVLALAAAVALAAGRRRR